MAEYYLNEIFGHLKYQSLAVGTINNILPLPIIPNPKSTILICQLSINKNAEIHTIIHIQIIDNNFDNNDTPLRDS